MDNSVIKIMNFNLWSNELFIEERLSNLIGLVYYHNCDVLCFQELTPFVFNKLIHKLGLKYPYIVSSPELETDTDYGIAIFSKHSIIKYNSVKLVNSIKDNYLLVSKIKKGNVEFNISTVQLDNFNITTKCKQHEQVLKNLENYKNSVLVGDFKIQEEEEEDFFLNNKIWKDSWVEDGENTKKKYTSNFKTNIFVKRDQNRFDRCLYKKKDLELNSFDLIGGEYNPPPSSHYGMVIKLKINDEHKINTEIPLVSLNI